MISKTDQFNVSKYQAITDRAELLHAQLLHANERHRDAQSRVSHTEVTCRINASRVHNPETKTWHDPRDPATMSLAELEAIEPSDNFTWVLLGFLSPIDLQRYVSLRAEMARLDAVRKSAQTEWHHTRALQARLEDFLKDKGVRLTDGIPVAPRVLNSDHRSAGEQHPANHFAGSKAL